MTTLRNIQSEANGNIEIELAFGVDGRLQTLDIVNAQVNQ